jgi:hypothetical protein
MSWGQKEKKKKKRGASMTNCRDGFVGTFAPPDGDIPVSQNQP